MFQKLFSWTSMQADIAPLWSFEYLMGQWRPTIGDPTFMGWFTVGSYFACAILSSFAAKNYKKMDRRSFFFWMLLTLLMGFLVINKQLDLQSLFTEIGRQIARHQGWMEQRRVVQLWFIVFFSISAIAAFILFAFTLRDLFKRFKLAFIGIFFTLSFIIIRAASFHHFEEVLRFRILDLKMNWILELAGIYSVITGALIGVWRVNNPSRRQSMVRSRSDHR
jgi:hypothetical protein